MAGLIRDVPQAPLEHADEREHRRLIADRANAIPYEQGLWTPTFDFATTGDLSNAYANQDGYYWRIGPLVHFYMRIQVTPTFTTSAGNAEFHGLPYLHSADLVTTVFPCRLGGTGITWPLDDVVGFISPNEDWLEVAFQGTAAAGQSMAAADITSAVQLNCFMQGFYSI